MKFKGIYEITEWDGSGAMVSVQEEYCNLRDYLKYHTNCWYYVTYKDGTTHKLNEREWEGLKPWLCSTSWLSHCINHNIRY